MNFRFLLSVLALFCSCLSFAQDNCLVSTNLRELMSSHPQLDQEVVDIKTGKYSALLKNGDAVLAWFAPCELSTKVHYLVSTKLTDDELLNLIKTFSLSVLPSSDAREKILPQLEGLRLADFRESLVLEGINDGHKFVFEDAPQPFIKHRIYYEWRPPQF